MIKRIAVQFFGILLLLLLLSSFLLVSVIKGYSMENTLKENDIVFIDKSTYLTKQFKKGDIVSACPTGFSFIGICKENVIKRIVATENDEIYSYMGDLYVNGEKQDDAATGVGTFLEIEPQIIPKGEVYLLGDNRLFSIDSREYGSVPINRIGGTYRMTLFKVEK